MKIRVNATISFPRVKIKFPYGPQKAAAKGAISKGMSGSRTIIKSTLSEALHKALEGSYWNWPRETLRQNGRVVSTPRNIVDTGKLKKSQKVATSYKGGTLNVGITYSAPYAKLVHYGGYIRPYGNNDARLAAYPQRPWVHGVLRGEYGIDKYNMNEHLEKAIASAWREKFGQ
jgi:hypothetical protein